MRAFLVILTIILSLSGGGCDFLIYGFGPHPRWPRYAIGFSNATLDKIDQVRLDWKIGGEEYDETAGIIVAPVPHGTTRPPTRSLRAESYPGEPVMGRNIIKRSRSPNKSTIFHDSTARFG